MSVATGLEVVQAAAGEARDNIAASVSESPSPEIAEGAATIVQALHDVDADLSDAADRVTKLRSDQWLSVNAKVTKSAEILQEAEASTAQRLAEVESRGADLEQQIRQRLAPSRPAGDVAAQEATLANVRADIQMRLATTAPEKLATTAGELLGRAIADGDELTTWFLGSTRWIDDYLATRATATAEGIRWTEQIRPEVLDRRTGDELDAARRVLHRLSGPKGLTTAVITQRQVAHFTLDDLAHGRTAR
jgi:hypothetical protein